MTPPRTFGTREQVEPSGLLVILTTDGTHTEERTVDALNELRRLLTQWEKEMTERWEEAEQEKDAAKKRADFYYRRMIAARNQLSSLDSLGELMTEEGGGQ